MKIYEDFETLLDLAIREDLSEEGDVTSAAIFSDETAQAVLYSKGKGILAGAEFFCRVYRRIDPELSLDCNLSDGDTLLPGTAVAKIEGPVASILSGERIALNFLSYLSGIATGAHRIVERARRYGATVILDTRKTLPGFRRLAKYAVKIGGAENHRMGLYDMVLIKDNHIDAAGSISAAVERVRSRWGDKFTIEVECRTVSEVSEAIRSKANIVMLDNMAVDDVLSSLQLREGDIRFEISGNMDMDKIHTYAPLGADYISVGRLTHSVEAFDFSLQIHTEGR